MSDKLILKGGRVIDPSQNIDDTRDVLLVDGRVAELSSSLATHEDAQLVDGSGLVLSLIHI